MKIALRIPASQLSACACLMLSLLFAQFCPIVQAGDIRHDVPDSSYLNLAASPLYASVGFIQATATAGDFTGSGVLIDSRWVVTAAHVVEDATITNLNVSFGGITYQADNWFTHPLWDGTVENGYDIGLVRLSKRVTGIQPAARYGYTTDQELGKVTTIVGFGITGNGLTGDVINTTVKRAGQNVIDSFGVSDSPTFLATQPLVFEVDFDNPLSAADSSSGSATPLALEYITAPGDSGGGAFVDFGAGPKLVGLDSYGFAPLDGIVDKDYGDITGFTRMSYFNPWIDTQIRASFAGILFAGTTTDPNKWLINGTINAPVRWIPFDHEVPTDPAALPEPSTIVLGSLGLIGLLLVSRRRFAVPRQ